MSNQYIGKATCVEEDPVANPSWPDPTPEMVQSAEFAAIWQCIKTWDISVPFAYSGYCGATGNHVRAILDALAKVRGAK